MSWLQLDARPSATAMLILLWLRRHVSHIDRHRFLCYGHSTNKCSSRTSGSLTRDGGENVPGIPGACATRNFTYLVRGPWDRNRFEIYGSALELISFSLCTRAHTWMFDSVYMKGNQMITVNVAYLIAAYITKYRFTMLTKNGGVITNDAF